MSSLKSMSPPSDLIESIEPPPKSIESMAKSSVEAKRSKVDAFKLSQSLSMPLRSMAMSKLRSMRHRSEVIKSIKPQARSSLKSMCQGLKPSMAIQS